MKLKSEIPRAQEHNKDTEKSKRLIYKFNQNAKRKGFARHLKNTSTLINLGSYSTMKSLSSFVQFQPFSGVPIKLLSVLNKLYRYNSEELASSYFLNISQ